MLPRKSDLIKIFFSIIVFLLLIFSLTHNSFSSSNLIKFTPEWQQARRLTFISSDITTINNLTLAVSNLTISVSNLTISVSNLTILPTLSESIDINSSFSSHNFSYIINAKYICHKKNGVLLLIYVHSSPDHFKRRMAIRETWGSKQLYGELHTVTVFIMGQSKDSNVQHLVKYESDHYGDIIQENFEDSYKNLTYKAIGALKWISLFCSQAKIVLKVDDDMFINIFNLVHHLQVMLKYHIISDKMILCHVWIMMPVLRDKASKWYVTKEEYFEDYYPPYCSGAAYILSSGVVPLLYEASLNTPFFWVDDSYVTGILAKKIGAVFYPLNSIYVYSTQELDKRVIDNYVIFAHVPGKMNDHYTLWNKLLKHRNYKINELLQ